LNLDSVDVGVSPSIALARVVLHSVAGPRGTALARWLDRTSTPFGELGPLVGPFARPIVRVSGPDALLREAAQSLPDGAARPEAVAVRLRRAGADLSWGAPDVLPDTASFLRLCEARGASSVELVRADPSLLTELQLGAFFHAYWRRRVLRRAACLLGHPRGIAHLPASLVGLASDAAFWLGVRSVATLREWERFSRSSYIVFYYHRIGHRGEPGQERLDVHPRRFERQLRLLRLLRFRPLSPEELLAFHTDPNATLPPRSYVLGADDGFRDAVAALRRHARLRPQVFVNTSWVGKKAWWGYDAPLASWDELKEFEAAGGVIASHCRDHPQLPELDEDVLQDELTGSLRALQAHVSHVSPLLAYPYGRHDERVRSATMAAGYRAAFTTEPGRNGAGTDVYCLRRIGLKDWDGYAALLWKAATGELLPWVWERWRRRLVSAKGAAYSG
jgi:peptidoglycan/xylan/chitin deacetylase (PgdA/CDA1 family)